MGDRAEPRGGANQRRRRNPPDERLIPNLNRDNKFDDEDEDEKRRVSLRQSGRVNELELMTYGLPRWVPEENVDVQRYHRGLHTIITRTAAYRCRYLDHLLHGRAECSECVAIKANLKMSDKEMDFIIEKIASLGGRPRNKPKAFDLPLALLER